MRACALSEGTTAWTGGVFADGCLTPSALSQTLQQALGVISRRDRRSPFTFWHVRWFSIPRGSTVGYAGLLFVFGNWSFVFRGYVLSAYEWAVPGEVTGCPLA